MEETKLTIHNIDWIVLIKRIVPPMIAPSMIAAMGLELFSVASEYYQEFLNGTLHTQPTMEMALTFILFGIALQFIILSAVWCKLNMISMPPLYTHELIKHGVK